MLISIEEALSIHPLTVFALGLGLVFVGLICIIILCKILGLIFGKLVKEKPAANNAPGKASPSIKNKGEFIAAVSAAIAEEMGTDPSALRILSVKKL